MSSNDLHRLRIDLEYDGRAYHGWQRQPDAPTVQGSLEGVIERVTGEHRTVLGSGRTDRGVHALGQVAAVDVPIRWTPARLAGALSGLLPEDIRVTSVESVSSSFHPRFDAVDRSYLYRVGTSDRAGSPFERPFCWPLLRDLDVDSLLGAAGLLGGRHSFRSFAKAGQPERGDVCHVHEAGWSEWPGLGFEFRIRADRFLHHMVRYLVGTMVDIASGRRPFADLERLLALDEDVVTSPPAPPGGLFLLAVRYPDPSA